MIKDGHDANAKSSLKLMALGAKKGERIVIRAEGEDAAEAMEALVEIVSARW